MMEIHYLDFALYAFHIFYLLYIFYVFVKSDEERPTFFFASPKGGKIIRRQVRVPARRVSTAAARAAQTSC